MKASYFGALLASLTMSLVGAVFYGIAYLLAKRDEESA